MDVKAYPKERKVEFNTQLINKPTEYALVREINFYDLDLSRRLAVEHENGLRTLIKAIVADESFLMRSVVCSDGRRIPQSLLGIEND